MELVIKVLGLLIGLGFMLLGVLFLLRGKRIIQWIQKQKYHQTAEPRSVEINVAKIIGILLFLIGTYYAGIAILSML